MSCSCFAAAAVVVGAAGRCKRFATGSAVPFAIAAIAALGRELVVAAASADASPAGPVGSGW